MMAKLLLFLVAMYRYTISPLLAPRCRFYPSCSCYAVEAITTHGARYGAWLTLRRLLRCHPWSHAHGVDWVPPVDRECLRG
ncbi:MAG: membrane protein insertion efficiency factor YidD [Mariprofundales bacterium]|nr:membrane protein insertion efficiency factor YidD [Mariprofundales bacterium]